MILFCHEKTVCYQLEPTDLILNLTSQIYLYFALVERTGFTPYWVRPPRCHNHSFIFSLNNRLSSTCNDFGSKISPITLSYCHFMRTCTQYIFLLVNVSLHGFEFLPFPQYSGQSKSGSNVCYCFLVDCLNVLS